jgi:hypothetical protein
VICLVIPSRNEILRSLCTSLVHFFVLSVFLLMSKFSMILPINWFLAYSITLFNCIGYIASNGTRPVNDDGEDVEESSCSLSEVMIPAFFRREWRKPLRNLSQGNWSLGRELNPGLPIYKAGVLNYMMHCELYWWVYICKNNNLIPHIERLNVN